MSIEGGQLVAIETSLMEQETQAQSVGLFLVLDPPQMATVVIFWRTDEMVPRLAVVLLLGAESRDYCSDVCYHRVTVAT